MRSFHERLIVPTPLLETWRSLAPTLEAWTCHRLALGAGAAPARRVLARTVDLLREVAYPLPVSPRERYRFVFAAARRALAEALLAPEAETDAGDQRSPSDPKVARILEALAALPDSDRRLSVRVALEGLDLAEAAMLEGRSIEEVSRRWSALQLAPVGELWSALPSASLAVSA